MSDSYKTPWEKVVEEAEELDIEMLSEKETLSLVARVNGFKDKDIAKNRGVCCSGIRSEFMRMREKFSNAEELLETVDYMTIAKKDTEGQINE